jgi:sulfatase modifying factor 1
MADVVISYKREDRSVIEVMAAQLHALGLEVWYDLQLTPAERYAEVIAKQIENSKSVIVCWSEAAAGSSWVYAEAVKAREENKLIACQLGPCRIPLPFNAYHTEDLAGWAGRPEFPGWRKIVFAVADKIGRPGLSALLEARVSGDQRAIYRVATKYPREPEADRIITEYEKAEREEFARKRASVEKFVRRKESDLHHKHREALKAFEAEFESWLKLKRSGDSSPTPAFNAPGHSTNLEELAAMQGQLETEHVQTATLKRRLEEADREFHEQIQKVADQAETALNRAKRAEAELQSAHDQYTELLDEHGNLKALVATAARPAWRRIGYIVGTVGAVSVFLGAGIFTGYRLQPETDRANALTEVRTVAIAPTENLRIYSESPKARSDCPGCPKMIAVEGASIPLGKRPGEIFDKGLEKRIAEAKPVDIKSFAMSETKITLSQYQAFAAEQHRIHDGICRKWDRSVGLFVERSEATYSAPFPGSQNPDQPVVCVTWADASAYADWLSKKSGQAYRLPTEAEWEFAAREGSSDAWTFPANACSLGNIADLKFAAVVESNAKGGGLEAPYMDCEDGGLYVVPDRSYPANKLGLFGMFGNAREWVQDCWHEASVDKAPFCAADTFRVQRGSGWNAPATATHPAIRWPINPTYRLDFVGFRVVKELSRP